MDNVADGVSMDLIDDVFVVLLGFKASFKELRDDAGVPHVDCMI